MTRLTDPTLVHEAVISSLQHVRVFNVENGPMMSSMNDARGDLVAEYLQTYLEWRERYGLQDACMEELLAAVLAECEGTHTTRRLQSDLRSLAQTIEGELRAAQESAA